MSCILNFISIQLLVLISLILLIFLNFELCLLPDLINLFNSEIRALHAYTLWFQWWRVWLLDFNLQILKHRRLWHFLLEQGRLTHLLLKMALSKLWDGRLNTLMVGQFDRLYTKEATLSWEEQTPLRSTHHLSTWFDFDQWNQICLNIFLLGMSWRGSC